MPLTGGKLNARVISNAQPAYAKASAWQALNAQREKPGASKKSFVS